MAKNIDLFIFGVAGDLANRKLMPALYRLDNADLLGKNLRIIGLARAKTSDEDFSKSTYEVLRQNLGKEELCDVAWARFQKRIHYMSINFEKAENYAVLKCHVDYQRLNIFYLATPPSLFGPICHRLHSSQCVGENTRIVLEKPIGQDLSSSRAVNNTVAKYFEERNIYRIDHYLGKETVQNLLALRFANRVINSQWDNTCIDHVQITAAETVGIEGRWNYYDSVGQLRDMVQNHLLQLMCMVAMEPPNTLEADEIRAEKIKLIRALRPINAENVEESAIRGQYSAGWISGKPVVGYMEERGSRKSDSETETFVALKAFVDNWRWAGVPFYLRTGKRMNAKVTQVVIVYKDNPHKIFSDSHLNAGNRLVIRLQPNEGIQLEMVSKKQSLKERLNLEKRVLNLDFFETSRLSRIADAYERLFLEVINGDQWLFVSRDEIEASWQWCDSLLTAWRERNVDLKRYGAGSWGPSKAEMLIERDQRSWYEG